MMKKFALLAICLCSTLLGGPIIGFWKTVDENTGQARSVIAIYEYKGLYYGRIIGSFNEKGIMKESIYDPKERAPGVVGNPFYSGLDIIWNLSGDGWSYKGKILDPEKGNVYRAELRTEGENLIVKGKYLFFSRSQVWPPALDSDFPKGFKKPDLKQFIPKIPQVN